MYLICSLQSPKQTNMHPATLIYCCFLLLWGPLPCRTAENNPFGKTMEGINHGLSNAERELGKALESLNHGITQTGREVERVITGQAGKKVDKLNQEVNHDFGQPGKEVEKFGQGVNHAVGKAGKELEKVKEDVYHEVKQSLNLAHHGGGVGHSGAPVNMPFINLPALWRRIANIHP
uniref:Suprabasin n=1 Tax=Monodelphis domestica TaxID=13616 RepID=F6SBE0_MONDO